MTNISNARLWIYLSLFIMQAFGFSGFAQTDSLLIVGKLIEEMPSFQGENRTEAFEKYINTQIDYSKLPEIYSENCKSYVRFTVDSLGSVCDITILKTLGPDYDNEIIRIIKNSPKWDPGRNLDKKINVELVYPVTFEEKCSVDKDN